MSVFLVKTLKIWGSWGLCPTPPQSPAAESFAPTPPFAPPPFPNLVRATGQAYKVLLPLPKF